MIKLEHMIHYTHKTGSIDKIRKIEMKEEGMQIEYCLENTEKICIQSETESFFNPLQIAEVFKRELIQRDVSGTFTGDLKYIYTWKKNKQTYFVALTESDEERNYFSIIYTLDEKNKKKPSKHLLSHRIWEREFFAENGAKVYPLRFRITPGEWPDIKINEADFTDQDIMSYAFEVHFTFDDVCDEKIRIKLPYQEILWKTKEKKLLCHGYELEVPNVEKACFSCFFDQCVTEIVCDNNVLIVLNQMPKIDKEKAVKNVSGNLDNIRIQKSYNPKIQVLLQHGTVATKIYGLRGIEYNRNVLLECKVQTVFAGSPLKGLDVAVRHFDVGDGGVLTHQMLDGLLAAIGFWLLHLLLRLLNLLHELVQCLFQHLG